MSSSPTTNKEIGLRKANKRFFDFCNWIFRIFFRTLSFKVDSLMMLDDELLSFKNVTVDFPRLTFPRMFFLFCSRSFVWCPFNFSRWLISRELRINITNGLVLRICLIPLFTQAKGSTLKQRLHGHKSRQYFFTTSVKMLMTFSRLYLTVARRKLSRKPVRRSPNVSHQERMFFWSIEFSQHKTAGRRDNQRIPHPITIAKYFKLGENQQRNLIYSWARYLKWKASLLFLSEF